MDISYIFDTPTECVERALRGFERSAYKGVSHTTQEVLNSLQEQFPHFTRVALNEIVLNFDDVGNLNI